MENITANQHYIWQHYLGAWRSPSRIWCKRVDKKEPFLTTTRNVGSERYFYALKELTQDDLSYIEKVISTSTDPQLRELNYGWVLDFQRTFVFRRYLDSQDISAQARKNLEATLSSLEKTLGEHFHTGIENGAIPLLDELRQGRSGFIDDPTQCSNFVFYLCLQYFRTAKIRNSMQNIQNSLPHDMKRTWPIEAFIYATNVGASIYRQRHDYRVIFLRNSSSIPFIAGDQPVINLRSAGDEALDFYYPLSPCLAMIYTADRERYSSDYIETSSLMVDSYNFQIYSRSERQIFGNDPDYLRELSKLPKRF